MDTDDLILRSFFVTFVSFVVILFAADSP